MTKSKYIGFYTIVLAFVITFILVGTVNDIRISSQFYLPSSFVTILINVMGKAPLFFIFSISNIIFFYNRSKNKKSLNIVYGIAFLLICFLSFFVYFYEILFSITNLNLILSLSFSFLMTLIFLITFRIVKKDIISRLVKVSFVSVLTIIIIVLITYIISNIWNRVSFIELNDDCSNFTIWYLPNIKGTGKSFPSKSVAYFSSIICLSLLGNSFEKLNKSKGFIMRTAFLCILVLAFLCITTGINFITDVTASIINSFLTFIVLELIFFTKSYNKIYFDYYKGFDNFIMTALNQKYPEK